MVWVLEVMNTSSSFLDVREFAGENVYRFHSGMQVGWRDFLNEISLGDKCGGQGGFDTVSSLRERTGSTSGWAARADRLNQRGKAPSAG